MNNFRFTIKRLLTIVLFAALSFSIVCFVTYNANAVENDFKTQKAPSIVVSTGEYDLSDVPNAVPDKPYKIFDATAYDMFGTQLDTEVKVYLFYSSQTRSRVYVEENRFTPICEGVYTVEYAASDRTGNSSKFIYEVVCRAKDSISATIENETVTATAGVPVKIGDVTIRNFYGNVGYSVKVEGNGRTVSVDDDGYFVPTYAGEYTVTYDFFDYNESDTCSYVVNVETNANPVIYDDVEIQKYFILGETYDLPLPTSYSFEFGYPVKITPNAKIRYENGIDYSVDDASNFMLKKTGRFSIVYTSFFNGKEAELEKKDFVCVDVGYENAKDTGKIETENYFYSNDGVKKETTRYGVKLTTSSNDVTVDFINKLLAVEFNVGFGFSAINNHFGEFKIILSDSIDKSQKIVISFIKESNTISNLAINGTIVSKVTTSFYNEDIANFQYSNNSRTVSVGNVENMLISKTFDGERFDGFTSEYINVSFEFSDVVGTSSMYIYKINNQTMSLAGDNVAPHLYYDSYSGGKKNLGDKITIPRLYLCDVFAPSYSVSYSVAGPDGKYVVDENGISLSPENTDYRSDYTFVANAYGSYRVSMKVVDVFGRSDEVVYGITVSDSVAPIVTIEDNSQQFAKVGDVITIRKAAAKDDVSVDLTVYAYLVTPTLYTQEYAFGDKIVLNQKGVYRVYYYSYDEAGNAGFAEYKITVE